MRRVVGIDPGAKETGIVLVQSRTVLAGCTVKRRKGTTIPTADYLHEVLEAVAEYVERGDNPIVGVESLVAPNPHMGYTAVMPLLGAAVVLGAVISAYPDAVLVRPGKNGSRPMDSYPKELRPTRGQGKGTDKLRHTRSAFDVACAARISK